MPEPHGYQLLAVGTDTEVFLRDIATKRSIPVCGLLGGTKQNPLEVPSLGKGFSVQEDNVMAEFNIPATNDIDYFISYLDRMKAYLSGHFATKGLELDISPSAMFDIPQLANKQAQTFGCDPDYDVWTLSENEMDVTHPALRRMRTAGGHVHVSFTKDGKVPEMSDTFVVVKALDIFLGIPSVLLDSDTRRRQIYGKAGAFRPKQYTPEIGGVEYRTLSNFWFSSPQLMRYVFNGVWNAFKYLRNFPDAEERIDNDRDRVLMAINKGDVRAAQDMMARWGLKMPSNEKSPKRILFTEGMVENFTAVTATAHTAPMWIGDAGSLDEEEEDADPE